MPGQSLSSLLQRIADDGNRWATVTAESSVGVSERRPGVTGIQLVLVGSKGVSGSGTNKKPTIRWDKAKLAPLNSKTPFRREWCSVSPIPVEMATKITADSESPPTVC